MNKKIFLPILLIFSISLNAQQKWSSSYFSGWSESVRGGGFQYHSPDPSVTSSLLQRSIDSLQYIEWKTETVPADFKGNSVQFVWIFGIDVNPQGHKYRLYLNGKYCLTFANPALSRKVTWSVVNKDISLVFRTTMLDKYDDQMGYATFTVPSSLIKKGEKQDIIVKGESAGSRTWYMTFEAPVAEKITLEQQEAVVRGSGKGDHFSVTADLVHLGDSCKVKILQEGKENDFTLYPGFNRYRLLFPEYEQETKEKISIIIEGQKPVAREITLKPVRHWRLYLVQHAHTDIGYTRPQTEILPDHLRYIDYALDYCDQTDSLTDDARFRWTCETSWAVSEYVKSRPPSQLERLKKRIAEGRIELTALYLNSSDLADEATIVSSLQPVKDFRAKGYMVVSAMQDDINGVPWCLTDHLSNAGIEFLNMGQNAERALKPFDIPTTFLWESPSGNRIVVNRAEHYMLGNTLGILGGREALEKNLFGHLHQIASKGYPYTDYAIQFSGYLIDNSPPSTTACRLVEEWNRMYKWPSLRLATVSEFPALMKKEHQKEMPVVRGAWSDWWMDGFGSAALTTAYTRMAHSDNIINNGLTAMQKLTGDPIPQRISDLGRQVADDLAFYDEHTFGAAESITDPECENSVVQLGEKLSYCWEAVKKNRILREELLGNLQQHLPTSPTNPVVSVINTSGTTRSGNTELFLDHQYAPVVTGHYIIFTDNEGKEISAEMTRDLQEGSYWTIFAKDVPPMGYVSYHIKMSDLAAEKKSQSSSKDFIENRWYSVRIDPVNGKIISIFDKEQNRELTEKSAEYPFGTPVYETLGKNREQIGNRTLVDFQRRAWDSVRITGVTEGAVWKSIFLSGKLKGCASEDGISCEIRLYENEKKIGFFYDMKKLAVTDPEGLYAVFSFALEKSCRVFYDVAGATVEAGKEQIPGSATDWQGIQSFVSMEDSKSSVTFVTPEIPLVQLGGLNLGKFMKTPQKPDPVVCSWVLNNYWTTNFLASQSGELKWSYYITSGTPASRSEAESFAQQQRNPMVARVLPASNKGISNPFSSSFMQNLPDNLLLIDSRPVEKGIIFNIRETQGKSIQLDASIFYLKDKKQVITKVNALGEEMETSGKSISIKPLENLFLFLREE